ncbi:hypothetical protein KFK09_010635 [Dendrobium nobile]|uniref:Uncharacterized protein n=1 Tax=Dendrobium nobile TaxID=94219 RepID=A0A8T3BDJ1_DENNO|nr:hypothetical protein KFK09_010635 [Dendrobium nobile]
MHHMVTGSRRSSGHIGGGQPAPPSPPGLSFAQVEGKEGFAVEKGKDILWAF